MARIRLYDLLPLVIKIRDQEASPEEETILQKVLSATEGQREEFEQLIEGLRRLIDVDSCSEQTLFLLYLSLGWLPRGEDSLFIQREWLKFLVPLYKMKGTVLSWIKVLRSFLLHDIRPTELFKSTLYEHSDYSVIRDEDHPYRAARVIFEGESPYVFGALGYLTPVQLLYLPPLQYPEQRGCYDQSSLTSEQIDLLTSKYVMKKLRDVVPIHVKLPTPICIVEFGDTTKSVCDTVITSSIRQVEIESPLVLQDGFEVDTHCTVACQLSCQEKCEVLCTFNCQTLCEPSCQAKCEKSCQIACESYCQERCELSCQNDCQQICQGNCQSTCQSACQLACQERCQAACQSDTEVCRSACQLLCQTIVQHPCLRACETSCQTLSEIIECEPPGAVCDTSVECATWYLPGTFAVERNTTLVGAEVRETAPSGVISCAVRSEHYSRDPEACTTALQLPFNPQYEGEDTSSIFVSVTGYWLQDIWIIVHGVDSNGVRRAYSSLTNQMGQCVIKVRPGTYSIAPYWTSYPKMSFEPKAVYSVQAEPQGEINVTFISSLELPDPGRGAWIGLSRTFCGWYGELDVDEPTDVVGYRRISNTEWSTIDLTWACMLSGIEPEVVPEGVRTFRNVGQWFFGPYEEKIEGLQYLILFDRREGGEVKAWSLLGEQVDIQPGQTLVIPVMSRPFFTIAREGRRTFLGDVIVSRLSVLVQITTPKVV